VTGLSSPQGALGLGSLGFLAQNGKKGKGSLPEGPWRRVGLLDGPRRRGFFPTPSAWRGEIPRHLQCSNLV
jgi:hypothetical protein